MMSEADLRESNALRNLQQSSEARGLKFYVNPPREIVPKFLGDFQPDAIALGPEGGIVIEVKRQRSPASEQQLAAIARRVSDQRGWEFRAIYLNPLIEETPPISKPTAEQLQAAFEEIAALIEGGHPRAALVTAWAALESLARLASTDARAGGSNGLSPIQAVQTLAEEGYIEDDAADRLRGMAKLRNAVVHGDLSADVAAEKVDNLLTQLRAIASDVTSVTPAQNTRGPTQ
jgi:uncharacterized protein YutE (UPF0331/DUF86 family)